VAALRREAKATIDATSHELEREEGIIKKIPLHELEPSSRHSSSKKPE
jgi:hypothetical protein